MVRVVISLGGSIISDDPLNFDLIRTFVRKMESIDNLEKLGVVVGGGKLARAYIEKLRSFGVNEHILDEIGINATRMNALAVSSFFSDSNTKIPETINDAVELMKSYRFVVMGGTEPGHTTDTVSALFAERMGAKLLINGTSVDGVYTADPRKIGNAAKIPVMSYGDAIKLATQSSIGAGPSVFMDITSLNIARRSGIKVYVIDGRKTDEYREIIGGGKTSGTVIF